MVDFCVRREDRETMKRITIAVDGYSSCGKSTLARQLAARLHYLHIDSGAMYRGITLYFIRESVDPASPEAVGRALNDISLDYASDPDTGASILWLNDENVEAQIREKTVSDKVSEVAAIGAVREWAVGRQRHMGRKKGIVMDGRDIGTTVFPDAELKLFMTADLAVRVERRYKELYARNPAVSLDEVRENLELRDYIDTHREISPLCQAADAYVLDNTRMTPEEQLEHVLRLVRERSVTP